MNVAGQGAAGARLKFVVVPGVFGSVVGVSS
jgi:hypothetical protein